ncbi:DUF2092 domain-containing protein [Streptomyces sp. NPDC000594]|uniref:LolA family protein n=1 Tax=Streptomyces sp. NPDC000594 TaxID=3154261 RepID=UPI00333045D0
MAANDSAHGTEQGEEAVGRRKKAARYAVPIAVAGVAAATIGLVPALAASGDPDLPKVTAQQLIEKIAASETRSLSGTVKISSDLGLPGLDGLEGLVPGGKGGGSPSAEPQEKLAELATGTHTLRVAVDGPDRQKISLLDDTSEYSIVHKGDELWAYNSESNEVHHETGLGEKGSVGGKGSGAPSGSGDIPTTPQEFAKAVIEAADGSSTSVTVDGTAQIAGRDAYQLAIKPKQSGSTIGSIRISVDSETGTPLKLTVNPSGGGKSVIDIGFTKVNFAKPAPALFDFTPPKGAKVVEGGAEDSDGPRAGKPSEKELKEFEKELGVGLEELENEFAGGLPGGGLGGGLDILGKDWTSIATFKAPGGGLLAGAEGSKGEVPEELGGVLDMFGDRVNGEFGQGRIFTSRLVNALMTDDGTVYVGAVTQDALVKAANAAK